MQLCSLVACGVLATRVGYKMLFFLRIKPSNCEWTQVVFEAHIGDILKIVRNRSVWLSYNIKSARR